MITSVESGSSVSFSVVSDISANQGTGFGPSGASDSGEDMAGTFTDVATSTVYAATANGNVLTGSEGPVKGLSVEFFGNSTGTGTVDITVGYAARLTSLLYDFTDSLDGPIQGAIDSAQGSIRSLQDDILRIEDRLLVRERILFDQFSRADQALQQLAFLQLSLGNQLNQLQQL